MRRLILSLTLALAAVLPAVAQSESLRLSRPASPTLQGNARAGTDASGWVNEFSQAPPSAAPQAQQPSRAGFVMDINANVNAPQPVALPFQLPPVVQNGIDKFVKKLGARELNLISTRDVIVLVDRSSSMGDKDCPAPQGGLAFLPRSGGPAPEISRWDWCEQELLSLSRMAGGALRQGIRLVFFANNQNGYDHVRLNDIGRAFEDNYPSGSTNAAAALKSQLEWYFANRATNPNPRPVVIAVITDGLPNSTRALKKVIIEATHQMARPDEVAITFLQIGRDSHGVNLVHEMDDQLVQEGAVYDIVDAKDFGELLQVGLGRALADAINEGGRVAQSR
jgi:hypothetical protein